MDTLPSAALAYRRETSLRGELLSVAIAGKRVEAGGALREILGKISFALNAGTFASIVGPSGCGKTTLLRCIAGLDVDYDGDILVSGEKVRGPSLQRGVVFQEARLLPWKNVEANIGFAGNDAKSRARTGELLDLVGLRGFERHWPKQLSGGMAQRVALARALLNLPLLLLLDEPFGALDSFTRLRMQNELYQITQRESVTSLLVTHDLDEALSLSDTIFVMSAGPGLIRQRIDVDLPRPRNRNSAAFISLKVGIEESLSS